MFGCHNSLSKKINSSDAGEGKFWFWDVNTMLADALAPKVARLQQPWYWLWRTDNTYCCFRVNFIYLGEAKSKIRFKMWIHISYSLKRFSMVRVNRERVSPGGNGYKTPEWTFGLLTKQTNAISLALKHLLQMEIYQDFNYDLTNYLWNRCSLMPWTN